MTIDAKQLEAAIKNAEDLGDLRPCWETLLKAARAHLATLPRTKDVKVWRVEWAFKSGSTWRPCAAHYATREEAEAHQAECAASHTTCFKVTGPHLQEIPA